VAAGCGNAEAFTDGRANTSAAAATNAVHSSMRMFRNPRSLILGLDGPPSPTLQITSRVPPSSQISLGGRHREPEFTGGRRKSAVQGPHWHSSPECLCGCPLFAFASPEEHPNLWPPCKPSDLSVLLPIPLRLADADPDPEDRTGARRAERLLVRKRGVGATPQACAFQDHEQFLTERRAAYRQRWHRESASTRPAKSARSRHFHTGQPFRRPRRRVSRGPFAGPLLHRLSTPGRQ
jgi:hypothetical protein